MSQTAVLYKVLEVKEQEKQQAQINRVRAVDEFEKVAHQLYQQLKEKEVAEERYIEKMQDQFTIDKMKAQSLYINNLSSRIVMLQQHVQKARRSEDTRLNSSHVA